MKLSHEIIKKLKTEAKKLNNGAVRLLLFVAMKADDSGMATGIYYKEFCSQTGMCSQSFYNAKKILLETGFISEFKDRKDRDIDIQINNNCFINKEDYKKGYINLHKEIFYGNDFWKLTDNAIIMCLDFLKNTLAAKNGLFIKNKKDMYKDYAQIFKVSHGRIWSYLRELRKLFSIFSRNGLTYVKPKDAMIADHKCTSGSSGEEELRKHYVKVILRRVYAIADKNSEKDLTTFLSQYQEYARDVGKNIRDVLFLCVNRSVMCLKRAEREINPAYIHKLIRREIGLETA